MTHPSAIQPINQLHDSEARWFAIYTRYKREKRVYERLREQGVDIYLPLQEVTRYYTRKIVRTHLPLISCYVFVRIVRKAYVPVLEDPDVLFFVKQKSDLLAIPEREINILRAITGEGIQVEVSTLDTSPGQGDEVEIIQGRLYGLKGILVGHRNNKRVVIELEQLGMALQMQLPLDHVRKTGNKPKAAQTRASSKSKNRFDLMSG